MHFRCKLQLRLSLAAFSLQFRLRLLGSLLQCRPILDGPSLQFRSILFGFPFAISFDSRCILAAISFDSRWTLARRTTIEHPLSLPIQPRAKPQRMQGPPYLILICSPPPPEGRWRCWVGTGGCENKANRRPAIPPDPRWILAAISLEPRRVLAATSFDSRCILPAICNFV